MKKIVLLAAFASASFVYGQQKVNISKGNTSIIIFPNDIENIKNGNDLEFNVIESDNDPSIIEIDVVKEAFPKKGTNLIIFTKDGSIYQLDLVLKENISNYINKITLEQAFIKAEQEPLPKKKIDKSPEKKLIENTTKTTLEDQQTNFSEDETEEQRNLRLIKQACENNEKRKKRVFYDPVKSSNIIMSVRDVAYYRDKIFLFIDIKNKGGQSYDIENINILKSTAETGDFRKSSSRDLIDVYHIHNMPKKIQGKDKFMFIIVLNKTAINKRKAITIRIRELGGDRDLTLNIKDQIINNPVKL